jgi:hypothetical protein
MQIVQFTWAVRSLDVTPSRIPRRRSTRPRDFWMKVFDEVERGGSERSCHQAHSAHECSDGLERSRYVADISRLRRARSADQPPNAVSDLPCGIRNGATAKGEGSLRDLIDHRSSRSRREPKCDPGLTFGTHREWVPAESLMPMIGFESCQRE